jgi:hypothetical protein
MLKYCMYHVGILNFGGRSDMLVIIANPVFRFSHPNHF